MKVIENYSCTQHCDDKRSDYSLRNYYRCREARKASAVSAPCPDGIRIQHIDSYKCVTLRAIIRDGTWVSWFSKTYCHPFQYSQKDWQIYHENKKIQL